MTSDKTSSLPYQSDGARGALAKNNITSTRRHFGAALLIATVVPFLVAMSNFLHVAKFKALEQFIVFLALIHVPMTMYLFFDPAIRRQVRGNPIRFVGVPVLILAACVFVFVVSTPDIIEQKASALTYCLLGVLSWNFWHFGKQNIGVYAYYRLSQGAGGMSPIERKLIYTGAFLGAVSAAFLGLRYYGGYQLLYSQQANFDQWDQLSGYLGALGKSAQYALALCTVLYIFGNRSRFGWKSGSMFFLCVNFFLPAYLGLDWKQWIAFYVASSFTHGCQYIVFLMFHSYHARHRIALPKKWPVYTYTILFLLLCVLIGDLYKFHKVIPVFHFADKLSDAYWMSLVNGFGVGVLLNHFWFDSFFWKFKNKEARDWMLERYGFLFSKP